MAFQPVDLFGLHLPVPQLPISGDQQQQENRELLAAISTPNFDDAGAMADCSPVDSPSPVLRNHPNFSPPAAPSSSNGNGGAHSRKNRPSECVVCGRPTNCCHFDVPSCLGCRSFFRRSVLQRRQYTCPRAGNCQIGDASQICRSCRFDRCLLGGMNLRAIKTFAQRPDLQVLSLELEKRRQTLLVDNNLGEQQPKPQQPFLAIPDSTSEIARLLQSLVLADDKLLHIRYSEQRLLGDMFDGHSLLDILEGHGNFLAKADHFSKRRIQQMSLQFHRNLVLNGPPGEGHPSPKRPNWLFVDSFLCLHLAKTLPVLRELSSDGKLRLFSHNALAATVFSQCFYSFSWSSNELLLFPDGFTPLCFQSSPSMDEYKQKLFCDNMEPFKRIGLTREEFLLLRSMLFLHTASIDELCPNDLRVLQAEQQSYSQALMQYERQRLGNPAGVQRYAELIFFIQFLLKVGNQHRAQLVYLMVVVRLHDLVQHPDFIDNLILGISNTRTLK